jgi:hypothetical protein
MSKIKMSNDEFLISDFSYWSLVIEILLEIRNLKLVISN